MGHISPRMSKHERIEEEYFQKSMGFKERIKSVIETPGLGFLKVRMQRALLNLPLDEDYLYVGEGTSNKILRIGFMPEYKIPLVLRRPKGLFIKFWKFCEFYAQEAELYYNDSKRVPEFCVEIRIPTKKNSENYFHGLLTEDVTDFGRWELEEKEYNIEGSKSLGEGQIYLRKNKYTGEEEEIYLDLDSTNSPRFGGD
jgi:hypothetical protein|tara:strand:+ start:813 stop:1406 length:594 start_codon:yes stop_codon:yes gene_type:complete